MGSVGRQQEILFTGIKSMKTYLKLQESEIQKRETIKRTTAIQLSGAFTFDLTCEGYDYWLDCMFYISEIYADNWHAD